MPETPRIFIVGAGISGLTCALELEEAGYSPVILEKDERAGGRIRTDMVDGSPLDHGFQVLLTAYPAVRNYLDLDQLDLRRFRPGAVVIKDGLQSKFGDFMRDRSLFRSTLGSHVASFSDKIGTFILSRRLGHKPVHRLFENPPGTTRQYLEAKGFSRQMIDDFFVPFFGGIFLEKELTTSSSMFAFIFKMFALGHAAIPANGMEEIIRQLLGKLNNTQIRYSTPVRSVQSSSVKLENGESIPTDAVIWTCPPHGLEPELNWRSCSTHYFYTNTNILNDRIIGLLPGAKYVNSIHYVTDLFGKEDNKKHLLSATVVGSANVILDEILADLKAQCGLNDLEHIRSYRIENALPDVTLAEYAPTPEETVMMPGVFRAGDVMANASLNAAMESGRVAAEAAIGHLSSPN